MATSISRRGFLRTAALAGGLLTSGALIAACGGGAEPTPTPAASGTPVTLEIGSKGDALEYDKTTLEVPAGSKVTLNLKNNASPGSGVLHNWVLVRPGTLDAVAADGIAAGEANGYLKPNDNRVIAHTKMAKEGETVSVTFDAPPPGTYDFVCTFPGHATLMRGKFIVK
ncbi:MAG: plastocyanin/azurin family copper-binding protein [Thermoflexales bacterium]|nr:plastocyanin/azurin family copper-binding protein [Thermoflexales bacterium]MDW8351812.1 plastocyanin/azurin family copper-binding protein [Anaerolineae bacterium]